MEGVSRAYLLDPFWLPGQGSAMKPESMATRIARVLGQHPTLALEFYCMASEVVDDFEDYGPVLQGDEKGDHAPETVIRRLQAARNELIRLLNEEAGSRIRER